ncbi:MAG: hypothetical protein RSD78_06070 [Oscillospiraceae bacterium]
MRYKIGNALWGIAFILAGVGFAGNAFNVWQFDLFFSGWWTLFIIVPCIIGIIQRGFNTGNSIGLAVGVLLLLSAQDILPRNIVGKLFLPVILIVIGLAIVFRHNFRTGGNQSGYQGADGNVNVGNADGTSHYNASNKNEPHNWNSSCGSDLLAVFCGNSGSFNGRECKGVSCTAVFGGVDLDLRGAVITKDITVEATAIFGGVDIFVDDKVQVMFRSVPIFGGVDCTVPARDKSLPTVFINCVSVFGGVDIK